MVAYSLAAAPRPWVMAKTSMRNDNPGFRQGMLTLHLGCQHGKGEGTNQNGKEDVDNLSSVGYEGNSQNLKYGVKWQNTHRDHG